MSGTASLTRARSSGIPLPSRMNESQTSRKTSSTLGSGSGRLSILNSDTRFLSLISIRHEDGHDFESDLNKLHRKPDMFRLMPELVLKEVRELFPLKDTASLDKKQEPRSWRLLMSQVTGLSIKKVTYLIRRRTSLFLMVLVPFFIMWVTTGHLSHDTWKNALKKRSLTRELDPILSQLATLVYAPASNQLTDLVKIYEDGILFAGGYTKKLFPNENRPVSTISAADLEIAGNLIVPNMSGAWMGALFQGGNTSRRGSSPIDITALYHEQGFHSEVTSVAMALAALHDWKSQRDQTIDLAVQLMPFPSGVALESSVNQRHRFCLHSALSVVIALTLLTSMFATMIAKERLTGSRHLQGLVGVHFLTFFFCNLAWDLFVYLAESLVIFCLLKAFGGISFIFENSGLTLLWTLFSFGVSSLPLVYCMQLLSLDQRISTFAIFAARVTTDVVLLILTEVGLTFFPTQTLTLERWLGWIFLTLNPNHRLMREVYSMCLRAHPTPACSGPLICRSSKYFYLCIEAAVGKALLIGVAQSFFWSLVYILTDTGFCQIIRRLGQLRVTSSKREPSSPRRKSKDTAHIDVRVLTGSDVDELIVAQNVVKKLGRVTVLRGINLEVARGECLLVVGREGSGKSALLSVLAEQTRPTQGTIWINNHDTSLTFPHSRPSMSFCPEQDALIDELTGRETLHLYARLRGIPGVKVKSVTNICLRILKIHDPDSLCSNYSMTNKKKLSLAIALLGPPQILLLDEPTKMLDHIEKRTFWQIQSRLHKLGCTVIMTCSDSEDCKLYEDRVSRIALLSEGSILRVRTPAQLSAKYGRGYTVMLFFRSTTDGQPMSEAQMPYLNCVADTFPNVEIVSDGEVCHIFFPSQDLNLSKVFALLEDGTSLFNVQDYVLQKCSLNHVYFWLSVPAEEENIEIQARFMPSFETWPPPASDRSFHSATEV